jgi:hypothetical protein
VSVPGVTLDAHLAGDSRRVRFLKCDVEGAEFGVFLGGAKTIGRWRPLVFTELVPEFLARYQHSLADVFAFFHERNYAAWETSGPALSRQVASASEYQGHDILLAPAELKLP